MIARLVSVIMPCYKMGRFVGEALESVARQTYPHWEIIVVDDAGPEDGTRKIVEDFARQWPTHRVSYTRHEVNQGVAGARNTALAKARGELVAILDPDDISLPARFARQVDYLTRNPDVGAVGAEAEIIDASGAPLKPRRSYGAATLYPEIWWQIPFRSPFCHSTVMARRDLLLQVGGYEVSLRTADDYDIWRKVSHLARYANLGETLGLYRTHGSNLSGSHDLHDRECLSVMQSVMRDRLGESVPEELLLHFRRESFPDQTSRADAARLMIRLCDAAFRDQLLSGRERIEIANWTVTRIRAILGTKAGARFLLSEQGASLGQSRPGLRAMLVHGALRTVKRVCRRTLRLPAPVSNPFVVRFPAWSINPLSYSQLVFRAGALCEYRLSCIRQPDLTAKPDAPIRYVTMVGRSGWLLLRESLVSMHRTWTRTPPVTVVSDGTWNREEFERAFSFWPSPLEVLMPEDITTPLHRQGADALLEIVAQNPLGLKLAAITHLGEKGPILFVDSDVLWFSDPLPVLGKLPGAGLVVSVESRTSYNGDMVRRCWPGKLNFPHVNTGCVYLNGVLCDTEFLGVLLQSAQEAPHPMNEQTLLALAANRSGGVFAENFCLVYFEDVYTMEHRKPWREGGFSRHYVNWMRHHFYRDAWHLRQKTKRQAA
jgi:hypothetical protein